jgi:hypothetical protein
MGTRSILEWTTVANVAEPASREREKFHAHWGSPHYKVPTLVDYFAACSALEALPSPAGYRSYAQLLPDGDFFLQAYTATEEPQDLSYRYEVHVVTDQQRGTGWRASLAVYRRHWGADQGKGFVGILAHTANFGAHDMVSGYRLAGGLLATLAANMRRVHRDDLAQDVDRRVLRYKDLSGT